MNSLVKAFALPLAACAALTAPAAQAAAHGYYYGPPPGPYYPYHHHHGHGNAIAAGVIGLAAGAIMGSALSRPSPPWVIYQVPPPPPYYPPPPPPRPYPVYSHLAPWSPGWYDYCASRFRSFNPRTGTFRGYDGRQYFCIAP